MRRHPEPWIVWLALGPLVSVCAMLQAREVRQAVGGLCQTEVLARWGPSLLTRADIGLRPPPEMREGKRMPRHELRMQ